MTVTLRLYEYFVLIAELARYATAQHAMLRSPMMEILQMHSPRGHWRPIEILQLTKVQTVTYDNLQSQRVVDIVKTTIFIN